MIKLGLTGGIGSGKSTVASILVRCGATLIDADAVSRQTTATSGAAMPAIAHEFGTALVAPDGSLDRDAMRALVFGDPAAKARLEAIVHPLVAQEIQRLTQLALSVACRLLVFDIPLLAESTRWRPQLDLVLVVDCSAEIQIQRVMLRSGWTREQTEQVINAQATRAQRLRAADIVICNEALAIAQLEWEVRDCAHRFGL
ncbi:MAG: dephospho-CoA kinase [Burkholderiaceae bacterium]